MGKNMNEDEELTVIGMWESSIEDNDISDLPDDIQEQYKVLFFSGVPAMIHVHTMAQRISRSKEEYVQLFERLHKECIELDEQVNKFNEEVEVDLDQETESKISHLKLVTKKDLH